MISDFKYMNPTRFRANSRFSGLVGFVAVYVDNLSNEYPLDNDGKKYIRRLSRILSVLGEELKYGVTNMGPNDFFALTNTYQTADRDKLSAQVLSTAKQLRESEDLPKEEQKNLVKTMLNISRFCDAHNPALQRRQSHPFRSGLMVA